MGQRLEEKHPLLRTTAGQVYERILEPFFDQKVSDGVDEFLDLQDQEPFFGLVHMMDVHAPYQLSEDSVEEMLARGEYPDDDLEEFFERHRSNPHPQEFVREHANERDYEYGVDRLHARYDVSVLEADKKIGRLVDGLEERGVLENTTIVVTNDHGESLDEHEFYFDHHGLYDQSIHVPLIVAGPDLEPGRREETVQLLDLAPTNLGRLGVETELVGESRSLEPLIAGEGDWTEWEFVVAREAHSQSRVAIRTDEYKLIRHVEDPGLERERGDSLRCGYCDTVHGGPVELYDLASDPEETNDRSGDDTTVVERLEERLESYEQQVDSPTTAEGERVEYQEEKEVLERLEELGCR